MRSTLIGAALAALLGSLLGTAAPAAADVPPMPGRFTGYAFDACTAPTQATMDAWRTGSPFGGVGVYVAGDNRACAQPNLTPAWVETQARKGWRILPITVGRQAACYAPSADVTRIDDDPAGNYERALKQGRAEATATVAASEKLGFARGTTQWLDIEAFPPFESDECRRSMLTFVSGWTQQLHKLGYRSGLYSSGGSGITAIEGARTLSPDSYALPEQVWFAHDNGEVTTRTSYLDKDAWRGERIHQYALNEDATYGGVTLFIDRNWMEVAGGTRAPRAKRHCGVRVDFASYGSLRRGDRGKKVQALQCLLRQQNVYDGKVDGRYDRATARVVKRFHRRHESLPDRKVASRRTWMVLHSSGKRPFLKVGASSEAVRRLQRTLNAAGSERLSVSGIFDRPTERAVKRYQAGRGLEATGVLTSATWSPLRAGRR